MLADAHRQAALDLEQAVTDMGDPAAKPYLGRAVIELYWLAAFHWTAYGCQIKHGKHKENHTKLSQFMRDVGEPLIGGFWDTLESRRRGGAYGHHTAIADIDEARRVWQDIRTWAAS